MNHHITEYLKFEETHKDYWVLLKGPHRTTQKSNCMSESAVQTLLELLQARCHDHCLGEPVPGSGHPLMKNLFQYELPLTQLNVIPLSPVTVTREKRSISAPPLPLWGCCRLPWGLPSVSSSLDWTRKVTLVAPHIFLSRPFTVFADFLWVPFNSFVFFILWCPNQVLLKADFFQ